MKSIVILISGRGSNLQALIHASRREQWGATIMAVVSDREGAPGLAVAEKAGIAACVVNRADYRDTGDFEHALYHELDRHQPDFVLLAGFMRVLSARFVNRYYGRLLNIHPSLIPAFPGLATHRQALDAGVRVHGATVHFVGAKLDCGPIVAQAVVPVFPGDSEETLEARVRAQEHLLYPKVVRWLVDGRISLQDGRVVVDAPPEELLIYWPGQSVSQ